MSQRLPDHTPASLGDVRAVSLASLLAQAEVPCENCRHIANLPTPDREPCEECDGSGLVLTTDGSALVGFLARHGFWPVLTRFVPEDGPSIRPCSTATNGDRS